MGHQMLFSSYYLGDLAMSAIIEIRPGVGVIPVRSIVIGPIGIICEVEIREPGRNAGIRVVIIVRAGIIRAGIIRAGSINRPCAEPVLG
jgi:hypothetical protein